MTSTLSVVVLSVCASFCQGEVMAAAPANDHVAARVFVHYIPGQESRASGDFLLAAGDGSEVEWRVELPPGYESRVAFAINLDVPARVKRGVFGLIPNGFASEDRNIVDHLSHGAHTSGHFGEYKGKLYIARLHYIDEHGIQHELTQQLAREHPELALALRQGFNVSAHVVDPTGSHETFGKAGGTASELLLPNDWQLRAFQVRSGHRVDAITFDYRTNNGAVLSRKFGGGGGKDNAPFILGEGEFVVKVRGRCGDSLDAIQFVTNTGRASPMYGGNGGKPFEIEAPAGFELSGMRMRTGNEVDRISPMFRPHR